MTNKITTYFTSVTPTVITITTEDNQPFTNIFPSVTETETEPEIYNYESCYKVGKTIGHKHYHWLNWGDIGPTTVRKYPMVCSICYGENNDDKNKFCLVSFKKHQTK